MIRLFLYQISRSHGGYPHLPSMLFSGFPFKTIQLFGIPHEYGTPNVHTYSYVLKIEHIEDNNQCKYLDICIYKYIYTHTVYTIQYLLKGNTFYIMNIFLLFRLRKIFRAIFAAFLYLQLMSAVIQVPHLHTGMVDRQTHGLHLGDAFGTGSLTHVTSIMGPTGIYFVWSQIYANSSDIDY